eukprot:TRINITY_DN844_c0_g2_i3.p1 TRINITY_DN844_c0_g2~~TRINITY_DN844_c0_g2_i3.p1  ORF type:complete len:325 (-),score=54.05 TRINITY_DN844_c0_g2_i3:85-1059(-)
MKIVFSLLLLHAAAELVAVDAIARPTAASNTGVRTFSLLTNIHILKNYTALAPVFYTLLIFSENGFIGDEEMQQMKTEIKLNGSSVGGYALGYDEEDGSTITLNKVFPFKPSNISIKVDNLHIVDTDYKNLYLAVLLLNSETDVILMKRVRIPFYFESGIWSNEDKTAVSLRFVTSFGYQPSAFMEFLIPSCIQLKDTEEPTPCDSIDNFSLSIDFHCNPTCIIKSNTITIHNINGTYPATNNSVVQVDISLPYPHHCDDHDYAYSTLRESLRENALERVVYAGINEGPVASAKAKEETESSSGKRVAVAGLVLVLVGIVLCFT